MKTFCVKVSNQIIGSYWFLSTAKTPEEAIEKIKDNLGDWKWSYEIVDLTDVIDRQYNGIADIGNTVQ